MSDPKTSPGSVPVNITSGSALLKQHRASPPASLQHEVESCPHLLFTSTRSDLPLMRCRFKCLFEEYYACFRLDMIRPCQYKIYSKQDIKGGEANKPDDATWHMQYIMSQLSEATSNWLLDNKMQVHF